MAFPQPACLGYRLPDMITKHPETQTIIEDAIFKFCSIVSWAISQLTSGPQVLEASALASVSPTCCPQTAPSHSLPILVRGCMSLQCCLMHFITVPTTPWDSVHESASLLPILPLSRHLNLQPEFKAIANPPGTFYMGNGLVKDHQGQTYRVKIQTGTVKVGGENGLPPFLAQTSPTYLPPQKQWL